MRTEAGRVWGTDVWNPQVQSAFLSCPDGLPYSPEYFIYRDEGHTVRFFAVFSDAGATWPLLFQYGVKFNVLHWRSAF